MAIQTNSVDWQAAISDAYLNIMQQMVDYAPKVLTALALIIIGWLVAYLLSKVVIRLLIWTGALLKTLLVKFHLFDETRGSIRRSHALLAGRLVFWVVLVFFVSLGAGALGLKIFSTWMAGMFAYLPNLLAGLVVIFAGYLLSGAARSVTTSAAQSAGLTEAELWGRMAQFATVFVALLIGVEQIGIHIQFITRLFIVVIGVTLFGVALAFGLGAKALVSNVIGAQQLRRHCRVGDYVSIAGCEGAIIDITATMLVLETNVGRVTIPACRYLDSTCDIRQPEYTQDK